MITFKLFIFQIVINIDLSGVYVIVGHCFVDTLILIIIYKLACMQSDAYQATGCYNLLCSGFVQTTSKIAIGASISPLSSYNAKQYDITILIWKVHISHT